MSNWKIPVAFVLTFLLPIVLAALSLRQGWYEPGTRNKGRWLIQEIHLLQPAGSGRGKWHLAYLGDRKCEGECRQVPILMQRIQSALGADMDRLDLVQLAAGSLPEEWPELKAGTLMLVDPQGLAILRYEVPASTVEWPLFGKAVLSDLRQLLKYQRGPQ